MAGPVKGNIGQEEIVLNDAATETTLLKLLAAIEKSGGGGGGSGGGGASEAQKNLVAMAQQTGKTTKELEEFEESVEDAGNMLTRGFGQMFASVQGLATEFLSGSSRMSDFTSHITGALANFPIVGGAAAGALQLLVSAVDQSVDTFRELSGSGIDLGSDLMNVRLAAADAGFTLDTFTEVVGQNSAALAMLGGSANAGAARFTEISKQLKSSRTEFSRLGLTMGEIAGFTADYMEQQTKLGRAQRMSDAQLAQGTKDYVFQLDYLSRVTGQQREEVAEQLRLAREDNRLKSLYANLPKEQADALDALMVQFADQPQDFKDGIAELFVGGGVAIGDSSRRMIAELGPQMADVIANIRNGTETDMNNVNAAFRDIFTNARKTRDGMGEQIAIIQTQNGQFGTMLNTAAGLTEVGAGAQKAAADQAAAAKDAEKDILEFESTMTNARNQIYAALINSGIFTQVQSAMSSFAGFLNEGGVEKIKAAIQPFTDWFTGLLSDLQGEEPIMDVVKRYLQEGLSKLGEFIKPMLSSAFSGLGSLIMGAIFGGGSDSATPEAGAEGGSGGGSTEASSGIFFGLDGALEKFAGLVAVGGAVYVAIKGFQTLLGGFAAPAVAAGALVITGLLVGTGGAIALAGQGISSAGDGIEKIASGLERMGAIEGSENIKGLGSALGDMGTAMLSLGAGNVLDSIMGFFGASSPFEKMVEGINEFSSVDPVALASMTSASGALGGLKSFADDIDSAKVEDFAEAIEKLAKAMEELNEEYADTKGFFGGGGPGSQDILNAIASGTSQGSAGVNSSIEQLVTLMRENNRISRQILAATGDAV